MTISSIEGVVVKENVQHADNRGHLSEVFTSELVGDDIRQANFTVAHPGVIKAFHWHRIQTDVWFCTGGTIEVALYDRREGSPTYGEKMSIVIGDMGANATIVIPPGVAHGYRVLGNKSASLFYMVTSKYNRADPDEERIPFDEDLINYQWKTLPR